ncbi:MAG: putative DNA binding domain-containing protein [Clostridiales bacterium]|nr:putative DNA binding domain-containing protein [Clostridiales bacterium]
MKENRQLEYKERISSTYLKTVSAFANYDGGVIVFGVNDEGEVVGISDIEQKCLDIENSINDNIKPQPEYYIEITNSDKTISLNVRPGVNKPYLYKGKAYKRNDTSTIEVDQIELKRLILAGENKDFEEIPSRDQNLEFSYLEKELISQMGIKKLNKDILKTLNLYSDNEGYNIAAAIVSDKNGFPGIDIAKFGESISIFQKRKTLEHQSILKSFFEAVEIYKDYYQYEKVEGFERKLIETIPEEAFREALANAIIHRVWDINSHIRVSMFDDYVEIVSVGGLPSAVTIESYMNGDLSVLRNPILANIFHRLNLIEKFGTGIRRIKESYADSRTKPSFVVTEDIIKVTLPLLSDNMDLTQDELAVYRVLSKNINKPISEIMSSPSIEFGKSKVTEILKRLASKKLVEIEGTGRGTKYRIKS